MWAKFSSALKQRPSTPSLAEDQDDQPSHADVLSSVYEQHPNLSVFHQQDEPTEVPFPSPSPPSSPSLTGRRNIFRRPKPSRIDTAAEPATSSPILSPLTLPKKVKSSLQNLSNVSELSLNRPSIDSAQRPSPDSARLSPASASDIKFGSLRSMVRTRSSGSSTHSQQSSQESTQAQPITPVTDVKFRSLRVATSSADSMHSQRPSQDSISAPPITPTTDSKFGSLRSILRDRKTPATGQSVRFFSRDAYKVITPDVSATSSEPDEISFAARLHRAKHSSRPAAQELFSTPTTPSLMVPISPPHVSNIFDLSTDAELPTIPIGEEVPLLDSAIEISEAEVEETANTESRPPTPPAKSTPASSHVQHDRSQSFSFGQTVFRSPETVDVSRASSTGSISKANRSRALSDTVFHSYLQSPLVGLENKGPPEADINDTSGAMVVYGSPEQEKREKDPFGANATTYYTPGTVLPPTPPQAQREGHGRKASREENLILSLRTQLALQSELCVQFELDLSARDELVRVLSSRLDDTERECERRKSIVKSCRKRVTELERCVQGLQDEVDRSREESMERSVMDEASGEALRMLHRRIEELERDRAESDRREQQAKEEVCEREYELAQAKEELARRDESERELKAGIAAAKEEMEQMGELTGNHDAITRQIQFNNAEAAWSEERERLLKESELLHNDQAAAQAQLADAREEIVRKDSEINVLKAEVEAQWRHTEEASEKTQELAAQRNELRGEVEALNERISAMEVDWSQNENRKANLEAEIQDLFAEKEDLERERTELEDQLRSEHEHSEHLTQALQECEDRVSTLEQERQYAVDRAARFEAQLKQRDMETIQLAERAADREKDTEEAQEEMARMKREHARIVNEQSRTLQDVVAREVEARAGLESFVREKAEADVHLASLKERLTALQEETERLRRQVHSLQQESADKEVKLANLAKQRAQDKEDIQGLNIALDSKQQELELLKRRIGVRGTAGGTPAQATKAPHHRRESSIFGTPNIAGSRPSSALSDTNSTAKERKPTDTPSTVTKAALAKSIRANVTGSATVTTKRSLEGAMGPPPLRASSTTPGPTPTRIPSASSTRTPTSTAPSSFGKATPTLQRRMSATSSLEPSRLRTARTSREPLASASESDEKEKENTVPAAKTRRMSVAAA
ncbi:uncharacterized protein FIBRA_00309 [Fibroporia radiculosa]|uniref:Uncharacterized protein n=1 Tax=Fibroporia radiculosa TaxID=599839 RepID=J7RVC6_9APHY|nr:uncharacterized protein FIBRA_00309 [Fibroporia radiculosa]CCL98315.1 predicted protein [Fibroporia radiculosa]